MQWNQTEQKRGLPQNRGKHHILEVNSCSFLKSLYNFMDPFPGHERQSRRSDSLVAASWADEDNRASITVPPSWLLVVTLQIRNKELMRWISFYFSTCTHDTPREPSVFRRVGGTNVGFRSSSQQLLWQWRRYTPINFPCRLRKSMTLHSVGKPSCFIKVTVRHLVTTNKWQPP